MGGNGRQPLSRRVPGATDMPKAQLRHQPPKLPDHVVERLRAEVSAARAKAEEQRDAQRAEQVKVLAQPPTNTVMLQRPKNMDGPRFPKNVVALDAADNDEGLLLPAKAVAPKPGVGAKHAAALQSAATGEVPQPPRLAAAPLLAPTVEVPQLPNLIVEQQAPQRADTPPPAEHVGAAHSPAAPSQGIPDSPPRPVVDSDDNTEPIPVIRPASYSAAMVIDRDSGGQRGVLDRRAGQIVQLEKNDSPDGRAGHDQAFVSASAGPRPRARASFNLAAAPKSSAPRQPTMLQTLFMETGDFEEVVASARAQAGGRQAGLEWRYRMVSLIVTVLVILAVLVFLGSH